MLFSLGSAKDAKVTQLGDWINGVWVWRLDRRRSFFEWEKPLECFLLQVLQGVMFSWRVLENKIATSVNLHEVGLLMLLLPFCFVCIFDSVC